MKFELVSDARIMSDSQINKWEFSEFLAICYCFVQVVILIISQMHFVFFFSQNSVDHCWEGPLLILFFFKGRGYSAVSFLILSACTGKRDELSKNTCSYTDLMKVLKAALWGLMHKGTRLPCWCSVIKRWMSSETKRIKQVIKIVPSCHKMMEI